MSRVGLTVSRRVGNAVVRNRVKRWLREVVRHRRSSLDSWDVVIIAKPTAAGVGLHSLDTQVEQMLVRLARHRDAQEDRGLG